MAIVGHILPTPVKHYRQHLAGITRQNAAMTPKTPISQRDLIAANVRRLMDRFPDLNSPDKLAKKCRWPYGNKKAGKAVGARTIRYLLDVRNPSELEQPQPAPSVDLLVAIAAAFGKQPWELLADDDQTRHYLVTKLMNAAPAPDERLPAKFRETVRSKK